MEKEEEEQKKIQKVLYSLDHFVLLSLFSDMHLLLFNKEQMRRAERKNRDDFRKMLEEDIAAGVLTARTHWRDYCSMVS